MKLQVPFLYLLIFILAGIVLLQRCSGPVTCPDIATVDSIRTFDTVYVPFQATVTTAPRLAGSEPASAIPDNYIAKTSYDSLLVQYEAALKELFAINKFLDTVRKDSSAMYVESLVQQNRIIASRYDFDLRTAVIRETVRITNTVAEKKARQLYVGGELAGNDQQIIGRLGLGLLYKDRKDRMFGIGADLHSSGQIGYSLKSYWKIAFK